MYPTGNDSGYEIGYDQITSNVNVTGTNDADATTIITATERTFDGGLVICEFFAPFVKCDIGGASDLLVVSLWEGGTQITRMGVATSMSAATANNIALHLFYRFTPSAGKHVYLLKAHVTSTTGTPAIGAGAGGVGTYSPAFLRFVKV